MLISSEAVIGQNTIIREDVVIEAGAVIGEGCTLDYHVIIRENTVLGPGSYVGAGSILGEYTADHYTTGRSDAAPLIIGKNALIRSGAVLYSGSRIGDDFSTGHRVTIREQSVIGAHVSVGTLCDIQGYCTIGDWVHMHSNVHIGQKSRVGNYVWIFPYTVLTNDPTPPSDTMLGVTLEDFSVICTGSLILPGLTVGKDALVGAGCVVTKDVPAEAVVIGNPGRQHGTVSEIRDAVTGEPIYPWRYTFKRGTPWADSDYDTWLSSIEGALQEK